jgi:hypothetical protein
MSPQYMNISRELLEDFKRYAKVDEIDNLIGVLDKMLYANKSEDKYYEAAIVDIINVLQERKTQIQTQTSSVSTVSL